MKFCNGLTLPVHTILLLTLLWEAILALCFIPKSLHGRELQAVQPRGKRTPGQLAGWRQQLLVMAPIAPLQYRMELGMQRDSEVSWLLAAVAPIATFPWQSG